jgi:hypothetical protein
MASPILRISDGTDTVDLLSLRGWSLDEWSPAVPEAKGGGIFRSSPLTDGRKLAYRKMDNIIDTFNLVGNSGDQNGMIGSIQKLQRLLEKGISYWTSNWQYDPVWIEARGSCETEIRYSTVVDYKFTGFGSPYRQPFFNSKNNVATEAILVIEHTFWQETIPGENGECVQTDNQYFSPSLGTLANRTFYPNNSSSDGTFQLPQTDCQVCQDLTSITMGVGYNDLLDYNCDCGIIFDNVTVPFGAYISKATLHLHKHGVYIGDAVLKITGQDPTYGDAVLFTNNLDFFARNRTPEFQLVNIVDGGWSVVPIDVTNIIQEIVTIESSSNFHWTTGDDLGIFISLYSGSGGLEFVSFDNAADYAELYIEYANTGTYVGRESTCDQEVMVTNKQNRAVISDVYWYDNDNHLSHWSDNLMLETLPYNLLPGADAPVPTTPAVGDILYIGSDTTHDDGGPFNNAVFDISVAQDGITDGVWEFYHGAPVSDWEAFDVSGTANNELCGDAMLFSKTRVTSIVFYPDENWTTVAVNGVTGYWIRFRVTSISGVTVAPIQHNRNIYTAVNPYIDIEASQVPGDIPALARIMFDAASCAARSMNTLVMGLRSNSRGENFTAYLNASDEQNYPSIIFTTDYTLTSSPVAPTGRMVDISTFDPETAWTNICSWSIVGNLAEQYIGVYHAYVRCKFTATAEGVVKLRLRSLFGEEYNVSYSDVNTVSLGANICAIDLGQLVILPAFALRPHDTIDLIRIYLDSCSDDVSTGYTNAYIYDIVLIPADEWSGNFGMPKITGTSVLYYGRGLDVDGITCPRQYRAIELSDTTHYKMFTAQGQRFAAAEWTRVASGEPIFQANADQRVWFLQYKHQDGLVSHFENCGLVCAQRSARYLLMRGSE